MSGRRYRIDKSPIRKGARPAKSPLMPDGLKKLKLDLAYEEAKAKAEAAEELRKRKARRSNDPPPRSPPPEPPSGDSNTGLLAIALEAAVPIRIHELRQWPLEHVLNRRRMEQLADLIGERGDVILYRGKKGKTADAFNNLVDALARLAHLPGGVTFNGVHYEAESRSA